MKIFEVELKNIKPYEKNAKLHDRTQIENVAESIKKYGFQQPIVLDKDNVIIIGHCRFEAAKALGLEKVPCVIADNLSEEQVKALRIVDNKSNESEWDLDLLSEDLADIDLSDFNFDFGIVSPEDYGEEFSLNGGDRDPIQTMSLTFSDEQAEVINEAISLMKDTDKYKNYENLNKNSNGNALFLVVEEWMMSRK